MKKTRLLTWAALAALLFCGWPTPAARAVSPLYGLQGLVAGGDAGTTDGPFDQARFGDPQGLAFDPKLERLYVADAKAGSLRVIELGQQNKVWTLGQEQPFDFSGAVLKRPLALAWLDAERKLLAVLDPGLPGLVVLDLGASRVSQVFTPQSGTAGDEERTLLAGATDLESGPGGLLVSAEGKAQLGLFDGTGKALSLRKTWSVDGLPSAGDGLKNIRWAGGYLLGILGSGAGAKIVRIAPPGQERIDFPPAPNPLPGSLSAVLPLTQPAQAASFVKDGQPFDLVCGPPYQVVTMGPRDGGFGVGKMGVYDQDDHVLGTQDPAVYMRPGDSTPSDSGMSHYQWLSNPGRAVADEETKTWYIADPSNHRVLFLRPFYSPDRNYSSSNPDGLLEYDVPYARRSYLRRVVLAGLSFIYYPADTERRGNSMNHRLEHYLNLEASLRGAAQGYESLFVGAAFGFEAAGMGTFGTLRLRWDKLIKSYGPDVVVVPVLPQDLCYVALDYNARPMDKQGLPDVDFDSEYALAGPDPARQPKAIKDLKQAIRRHHPSTWSVSSKGEVKLSFDRLVLALAQAQAEPDMMAPLSELVRAYVQDLKARVDAASQTLGHPVKLVLVYFPIPSAVSQEEAYHYPDMVDPKPFGDLLSGTAGALGIPYVDLTSSIRLWSANAPYLYYFSNTHMTARGQDAGAYLIAHHLFDLAGPGAQP